MPILWRYALHSYLRVFFLCICTFVALLLLSRFKDVARFAALCGSFSTTSTFIAYQIPLILPIAIPISALITSFLLFQKLSRTSELTALRASGVSLQKILTPVLCASLLLSLCGFSCAAEVAPYCRRESRRLIFGQTTKNPLVLLQRKGLLNLKNAFIDMRMHSEEKCEDFFLIAHSKRSNRLSLVSAAALQLTDDQLKGEHLSIVSYLPSEGESDVLFIENQAEMETDAAVLSDVLKKNYPNLDPNSFSFKMLTLESHKAELFIEMLRRISLSLAVFSFTFLGCAFGCDAARVASKKNLWIALALMLTVLVSYLMGKTLKNFLKLSYLAFFLPHLLIWICASLHLQRLSKGRI